MKGIAITSVGIEDAACQELKEMGASNIEAQKGAVLFEVKTYGELAEVAYLSQAADRVLLHLAHFSFSDIEEDIKKQCGHLEDFREFVFKGPFGCHQERVRYCCKSQS